MTTNTTEPQPSGCLRVGFAIEALYWLGYVAFGLLGMIIRLLDDRPAAPALVLGTMVAIGLVTATTLCGLSMQAAIRGGGLFTRKMSSGGTGLAIALSLARVVLIGLFVFGIIGVGLGITR